MNTDDREQLVAAFEEVLERRSRIDTEAHVAHHRWVQSAIDMKMREFVESRINELEARRELWQNARNKAFFPAVGLLLGALFVAGWHLLTDIFSGKHQ